MDLTLGMMLGIGIFGLGIAIGWHMRKGVIEELDYKLRGIHENLDITKEWVRKSTK
ncbi:hypothetical protein [uncultured Metabacillus sp.]|nr:hypothetical protein [uncultured Metabacillus sp.]